MESAATRLAAVEERIAHACRTARRERGQVTLVAVSKTHPGQAIEPLIAAGQRTFGENRVQEAQAKWPALRERHPAVELHLIGQLQSNKADDAVALFDCIHSLDRPSLVAALAKAMDRAGRRIPCFVQVNVGDEPQKGGCALSALPALLATEYAPAGKRGVYGSVVQLGVPIGVVLANSTFLVAAQVTPARDILLSRNDAYVYTSARC